MEVGCATERYGTTLREAAAKLSASPSRDEQKRSAMRFQIARKSSATVLSGSADVVRDLVPFVELFFALLGSACKPYCTLAINLADLNSLEHL